MQSKTCKKCGTEKPATTEFFRAVNSNGKIYFFGSCIVCTNEEAKLRMREYLADPVNAEKQRQRAKQRTPEQRQAERAASRARRGKSYIPGGAAIAAKQRSEKLHTGTERGEYKRLGPAFERHMDRLAEWNAHEAFSWWIRHKAKEDTVKAFYADRPWANPRLGRGEQWRLRYALDPSFNAKERIRTQIKKASKRDGIAETIRSAIRRQGNSPFVKRELGYTIDQLRTHLERQFHNGMTWQAFLAGDIHIDHIMPKASFDFSKHNDWVECWSLSNLRPLWARDNLSKSDKQTHLI
jgi:hypothetical protein